MKFDNYTMKLNNPITEEQWDMISDVDFDRTEHITFYTKHGKEVHFYKNAIPIQFLNDWSEQNEYDETIPRTIPLVLSDWEDWKKEMSELKNKREKALELLLDWAIESGYALEIFGEKFEEYEEELEKQNLGYKEGLIWIAEQEIKKHETNNI